MDDPTTRPARRPSATALLAAAGLSAAVLGVGGVAYAQTAEPTDPDAAVTQEQECEDRGASSGDSSGDGSGDSSGSSTAPSTTPSSADV